ncbi:MAG: hypothetical protein ACTSQA_00570 [Candidatus Heimdallarchaeaceae archaeon]
MSIFRSKVKNDLYPNLVLPINEKEISLFTQVKEINITIAKLQDHITDLQAQERNAKMGVHKLYIMRAKLKRALFD